MTPRNFISFFQSRTGALLLFLLLLLIAFILVYGFKGTSLHHAPIEAKAPEKGTQKSQVVQTVMRAMSAFNPPKEAPLAASTSAVPIVESKKGQAPALPPLSLFADSQTNEHAPEPLGDDYAPFGRLIQCELVVTVDSSTIDTPIIGLVTDDVWHNGRLIIPAGTEVHGKAKTDRVRERIASAGSWTLVWQTGEELIVDGVALDREKDQNGDAWGVTDGSAGLRGELLKSDDLAEIKMFAAAFLSGAASGLTDQVQTIFGPENISSLQNASVMGAQQVLNVYAQRILDTIERDGFYVRVPAGKQFYLYVTQTIDSSKATIGGTRLAAVKKSEEENKTAANDPLNRLEKNIQRFYSPVQSPVAGPIIAIPQPAVAGSTSQPASQQ